MTTTLNILDMVPEDVMVMPKIDEADLVYKGPWVRSAEQRLFQTLETDYGFPKATCRSLVNLMWEFLNETFNENLHEGQMTFHAVSETEPPGKRVKDLKSKPVHLTIHDNTDIEILSSEGIAGLRQKKIIRMAHEALDQGCLLTQEDLAVLLCSSRRTIRRDISELKGKDIEIPTRGTIQDIGPGVTHKAKVVKLWLEGYEYTDMERRTGHSGTSVQRYISGFTKVVRFHTKGYSPADIRGLTDMSERLIKDYIELYYSYKDKPESRIRMEHVLAENSPVKKNTLHLKRRGGGAMT